MDSRARREGDQNAVPSAKFLQARITALSTTLIKRLENVFAAALDDNIITNDTPAISDHPPSLTDTAVQRFQLEAESTALVRAAEEIMVLTRTMKEIWLLGGLETIKPNKENGDTEVKEKVSADARDIEQGIRDFLDRFPDLIEPVG